jgi:hypothetical protein
METGITHLDIYNKTVPYTKASGESATLSVPLFEIPAGTLLFRGVQLPNPKKDEDPRLFVRDWLGYPRGERFCMTPVQNTFFYTSPYVPFGAHTVGEWFNAIMIYQTVKDVRVLAMISPSKWTRGGKEIKALDGTAPIQRCDKFDYSCFESKTSLEARKEKEQKAWDNCIEPDFAQTNHVSGWMAIADYDSLDNFKEGLKGKDTTMGKYIMELEKRLPGKGVDLLASTYTDATNHRGFPEVVLFPWSPHPGTENQYTEARTEEDAADAIAEMSDKFNYLPIACITERGILEAFSGDFKAGDLPKYATSSLPGPVTRARIDEYQTKYLEKLMTNGFTVEGLPTARMRFDTRTGFYAMDTFTRFFMDERVNNWNYYNIFLMSLQTPEERDRVLEYKIKFRTFDPAKWTKGGLLLDAYNPPKLIDGTVVGREFIFERPDELYKQFKELDLKLPSKMIPFVWSATEVYQKNMANRKQATDPRGAEEALRKAEVAKAKVQESLAFIAKKKAEREAKKGGPKKPEVGTPPGTPPLPTTPLVAQAKQPRFLKGKQTEIPIVRTMEEAIEIGLEALDQPALLQYNKFDDGLMRQIRGPWEINEPALRNTLNYLYNNLHHPCYLLCVKDHVPYIFKLEGGGMNPLVRSVLEQQITEKGITDVNLDTSRVMQCIIKPYSAESTTANEWLGFLQNPLNQTYPLPNGVFILNLSDTLLLRTDDKEPFDYFLNPLPKYSAEYRKAYFLPIFSYSGKYMYDDIVIPNFDDIFAIQRTTSGAVALNEIFEGGATFAFFEKPINKAVFRGGTTGCGSTADTNMRIKLTSPQFLASLRNKGMLDVGLTTITKQYKMDPQIGLSKVDPTLPVVAPLTITQQSNYKFIIHIDGNVHAYRLLKTMLTGSCILRVRSEYNSWMDFPMNAAFQGFDIRDMGGADDNNNSKNPLLSHWVWVDNDLSNLDDVLDWCKENEGLCIKIGQNARELAVRSLSMNYIFSSFANLLASSVEVALSDVTTGGAVQKKQVYTRKQMKKHKRKTRKHHGFREKLQLAEYRGGEIDDGMASYIQNTMSHLWKVYIKNRRD